MRLRNPFYRPPETLDVKYVIVQPFATITRDFIRDDLVEQLTALMQQGYTIQASTASLDGAVHYVLVR